jgi:hypothetical protein
VEERFFLNRIALGAGCVSPGNIEGAAAVIANLANAGLAVGDGTAMAAGEATHAVVVELFVKTGISLANVFVENAAEGGHGRL